MTTLLSILLVLGFTAPATAQLTVKTSAGALKGASIGETGVRVFKGIPYAAPPVGDLRWQAPAPVAPWTGVRDATAFGPACMQAQVFADINFKEKSEDCLTLNIWTPVKAGARAPVMVWIHGGGFFAGGGAEPRHDGEAFARRGIVLVTINYRLGIFGFFAHPELTKESGRQASGNYGMLDQVAALKWVHDNIAAFGGNPGNVTIFGESAGSFAVSALVASPLAKGLFQKAIGESGAFFSASTLPARTLASSEEQGAKFGAAIGADSVAALRARPAAELLAVGSKAQPGFGPTIDGYFLREDVPATYAAGRQNKVPLLAGWNADEIRAAVTLRPRKPTPETFAAEVKKRFGESAEAILRVYPASTPEEALEAEAAMTSDLFISYATWKWIESHQQTSGMPVYRYSFDRKIPVEPGSKGTAEQIGARHAGEIEYVFGTLDRSLPKVPWEPADRALSEAMTSYWANFARTGDPSGKGLPAWPRYDASSRRVLHLDATIRDAPDATRARYEALDAWSAKQGAR